MKKCIARISLILLFLAIVSGCSGGGDLKLVPVAGKIILESKMPNTKGDVVFYPDEKKGNTSNKMPRGRIGPNGTFKLTTDGKDGAPLGWYKVTVAASIENKVAKKKDPQAPPIFLVREDYMNPTRTPIAVEVKSGATQKHYTFTVKQR